MKTRRPSSAWPRTVRPGVTALLLILAATLLACFGCCGGDDGNDGSGAGGDTGNAVAEPVMPATQHILFIKPDTSTPGRCIIVDAEGNSDVEVKAGDHVVWNNQTGSDVQLNFGNVKRLFGVLKAVSYGTGSSLDLQVRDDAEMGRHGYTSSCGAPQPGPGIIVCPPAGC
jgi:hypothetical protein